MNIYKYLKKRIWGIMEERKVEQDLSDVRKEIYKKELEEQRKKNARKKAVIDAGREMDGYKSNGSKSKNGKSNLVKRISDGCETIIDSCKIE